jgi:hypothetical protein
MNGVGNSSPTYPTATTAVTNQSSTKLIGKRIPATITCSFASFRSRKSMRRSRIGPLNVTGILKPNVQRVWEVKYLGSSRSPPSSFNYPKNSRPSVMCSCLRRSTVLYFRLLCRCEAVNSSRTLLETEHLIRLVVTCHII